MLVRRVLEEVSTSGRSYLEHQRDVVERDRPDVTTQSRVGHYTQGVSTTSRVGTGWESDELIWRIVVDGINRRNDPRIVQSSHPRVLVP